MKPEKVHSLLYAFIENRRNFDVIDGGDDDLSDFAVAGIQVPKTISAAVSKQAKSYFGAKEYGFPAVVQCGYGAAEYDNPVPRYQFEGTIAHSGNLPPVPPLQMVASAPPGPQSPEVTAVGQKLVQLAAKFSSAQPDKSAVKFEKNCMIVKRKEHTINVPIIRLKSCSNKIAKVTWKTSDKTACSGTHYIGSSGDIIFGEGEIKKIIEIKILNFSDEANDLRFMIHVSGDVYEPAPMTVTLKNIDNFYPDERNVVDNLPTSPPFTIADIGSILHMKVTERTFYMALTHLCSPKEATDVQFALACELSLLCIRGLSGDVILNILKDFFRRDDDIDF